MVAVAGSTIQLPNNAEIMAHFGTWHPAKGGPCPMARVFQAFDVLNQVTLDALIALKALGERDLAAAHCACLGEGDLVLLDRGYPAFWLFMLILSQKLIFVPVSSCQDGKSSSVLSLPACLSKSSPCSPAMRPGKNARPANSPPNPSGSA
jgi:hypothetical protein